MLSFTDKPHRVTLCGRLFCFGVFFFAIILISSVGRSLIFPIKLYLDEIKVVRILLNIYYVFVFDPVISSLVSHLVIASLCLF